MVHEPPLLWKWRPRQRESSDLREVEAGLADAVAAAFAEGELHGHGCGAVRGPEEVVVAQGLGEPAIQQFGGFQCIGNGIVEQFRRQEARGKAQALPGPVIDERHVAARIGGEAESLTCRPNWRFDGGTGQLSATW